MNNKIINHPKKNQSPLKRNMADKLSLKYPRLERNLNNGKIVEENKRNLFPFPKNANVFTFYGGINDSGYITFFKSDIYYIWGESTLDHVLYRSLKLVYGPPDFIAGLNYKDEKKENGGLIKHLFPIEWGYLIKINSDCYIDIYLRFKDRAAQIEILLKSVEKPDILPKEILTDFNDFKITLFNLIVLIDKEYDVSKEISEKKSSFQKDFRSLTNLYYHNLRSAKDMLEIAKNLVPDLEIEQSEFNNIGNFDEGANIFRKTKIFYTSSIMFSMTALESFINLLYKLLIKEKFKNTVFRRSVWNSSTDLRILHLPVYCKGFTNSDITPKDKAYINWEKIRPFRNDLVHGNISDVHEAINVFEDHFSFLYRPLFHKKIRDALEFHTDFLSLYRDDAEKVIKIVEEIVEEIISKLDKNEQEWVYSWIDELIITYTV